MRWVYVLRDDSDGSIYVGETMKLYSRWYQHQTGRGGVNTSSSNFNRLIGLYNVSSNTAFLSYRNSFIEDSFQPECEEWDFDCEKEDALEVEKHISQRYIYEHRDKMSISVRGGPYTTEERYENFRFGSKFNDILIDRPLCKCGYPCEVKIKNDKSKIYFICPLPNWDSFYDGLDLEEPCDFWKEFKEYRKSREIYSIVSKKQYEWWVSRIPQKTKNDYCLKCKQEYYNAIWSAGSKRQVCIKCFYTDYDSLKTEYIDKPRDIRHIFSDTIETS